MLMYAKYLYLKIIEAQVARIFKKSDDTEALCALSILEVLVSLFNLNTPPALYVLKCEYTNGHFIM